jgi:hypothetical protein
MAWKLLMDNNLYKKFKYDTQRMFIHYKVRVDCFSR